MARIRFAAGVLLGAAVLRLLAGPGLVNYDTLYALVWGRRDRHLEVGDVPVRELAAPYERVERVVVHEAGTGQ